MLRLWIPSGIMKLEKGSIHLWHLSLEGDPAGSFPLLAPDERVRAERYRFEKDRRHFANARAALRRLLARGSGLPEREIRLETDAFGKPFLANCERSALPSGGRLHFNLSHSGGRALYALSRDVPLGVDLETLDHAPRLPPIARSFCAKAEIHWTATLDEAEKARALLRLWTMKEAWLKAVGTGFQIEPASLDFSALLEAVHQQPAASQLPLRVDHEDREAHRILLLDRAESEIRSCASLAFPENLCREGAFPEVVWHGEDL